VYRGGLWVVGGGTGQDLLRSGRDLEDVWRLDLSTLVSCIETVLYKGCQEAPGKGDFDAACALCLDAH
jgi:hypothetical protein